MSGGNQTTTRIWKGVEGLSDKFNDIVISKSGQKTRTLCIFFGGDVQNFENEMVAHRDHGRYKDYRYQHLKNLV